MNNDERDVSTYLQTLIDTPVERDGGGAKDQVRSLYRELRELLTSKGFTYATLWEKMRADGHPLKCSKSSFPKFFRDICNERGDEPPGGRKKKKRTPKVTPKEQPRTTKKYSPRTHLRSNKDQFK